ncbi:hypothetical protein CVIRNUC_005930 [Coccomyxa viridis]|uniref:microtubule-severing ATPase n=1 Tax=Coccomyxa viridis TaxID=1274662 RepID=A0AAV1I9M5_9CHLO|nr:hypothetical protein CVIRNUC_005930 [Coccomyxa viridis]
MWLFRSASQDSETPRSSAQPDSRASSSELEKLRGYHDLAKDALERAYRKDVEGSIAEAIKLYRLGLSIIYEGLSITVQATGLGAAFHKVAAWRGDMNNWQQHVLERVRDLETMPADSPTVRAPQRITLQRAYSHSPRLQSSAVPPQSHGVASAGRTGAAGSGVIAKEEARLREVIEGEVLDRRPSIRWKDIAGLAGAKQALQEMVILPAQRADLFQGLRAPARGLLLYGPPGNGKTMLAKALASEARATFFNISASSLTSKWHGEAEKLVRMLFKVAAEMQPAIIFIDEIDSILSERSAGEHEASRRLKTQFLVEFDGVANGSERMVVVGATNRPQELDDAVRRRLVKRIYISMPDAGTRRALLQHLLSGQPSRLSKADVERIVAATNNYSGSDLAALCREAAIIPIRDLGPAVSCVPAESIRPMDVGDFEVALRSIRPSVSREQLAAFADWTAQYGTLS